MRHFIAICYTTVLLNSQLYNVWSVADMAEAMPMSSAQPGQPYLAVLSTLRQERSLNPLLQPGSPRAPLLTSHTAVCPSPPRKYSDISIDGHSSDSKATERD